MPHQLVGLDFYSFIFAKNINNFLVRQNEIYVWFLFQTNKI